MISFSGIDGAGKSTQIELLEDHYNSMGRKYNVIWARGGWTPGLEFIKNLVRTDKDLDSEAREAYRQEVHSSPRKRKILLIGAILDLYWYFGVYYRYLNLLKQDLVCDRYIWDTYVDWKINYSEYDFENWWIWKILLLVIPYPKTSFLFVISEKESALRCSTKIDDTFESEEVKQAKIDFYSKLVKKNKWTHVIKGDKNIQDIFDQVKDALNHEN
jgi:thymidylate kinase